MPGIAITSAKDLDKDLVLSALRRLEQPEYAVHQLAGGRDLTVAYAVHGGYPLTTLVENGSFIALEGAVYGVDAVTTQRNLVAILRAFESDWEKGRNEAEKWAAAQDGDFVLVVVLPRQSKLLVLNDTLGRLPLYFYKSQRTLIIARELKFLQTLNAGSALDRQAIAQILLFGWPLGSRTTMVDARLLPAGSSLYAEIASGRFEVRPYHSWDFESLGTQAANVSTAEELAAYFVDRCRAQAAWSASRPLVVSLSGGLDSRIVAAGLARAGAPFSTVSWRDYFNEHAADANVAQQIAAQLRVAWKLYELQQPTWEDAERLTRLRDGLNYVGVSHMLEYLTRVRGDVGLTACMVTGDGGDKALGEIRYPPLTKSLDDFVSALMRGSLWPLTSVAEFVGLPAAEIRECVREHVASYPERSPRARSARFAHTEHAWRWLFEGEDRNRAFLWSMTPFYTQSFLARALAVSPKDKRDNALYERFIRALDPEIARIPNANWGAPVGSLRARLRNVLYNAAVKLPRPLRSALRRRVLPFHTNSNALPNYQEHVDLLFRDPLVSSTFSKAAVDRQLERGFTRLQSQVLITQLLYVRQANGELHR
jgi:asparagine synthase (glutamine-hydrolysing)